MTTASVNGATSKPRAEAGWSVKLAAQQIEAGAAVLGAWFDHEKFRTAWRPDPELFGTNQQQACAGIMAQRGAALTIDGLVLALRRGDRLKLFPAGAEDVHELVNRPWQADPWAVLQRLLDCVALQKLRQRLDEAARAIDSGADLHKARKLVGDALRDSDVASGARARTFRQVLQAALDQATREKRKPGAQTISRRLDRATGGVRPHNVWVYAGETSHGKTSFLCGVALLHLLKRERCLIVSAEDPEVLYGQRLLQFWKRINALHLRDGELHQDELDAIRDAVARATDEQLFLDAIGRPIESVASDIRSMCASEGITLVFGDYAQAFRAGVAQQDRRNEVNYCARLFTDAVKQSGAGGILFSQLTTDASTGKRRARESEDLHNSAEVLVFGFTEREAILDAHGKKTAAKRERKFLWVDKVKDGPAKFKVELAWDKTAACFIADDEDEAPDEEIDDAAQ